MKAIKFENIEWMTSSIDKISNFFNTCSHIKQEVCMKDLIVSWLPTSNKNLEKNMIRCYKALQKNIPIETTEFHLKTGPWFILRKYRNKPVELFKYRYCMKRRIKIKYTEQYIAHTFPKVQ